MLNTSAMYYVKVEFRECQALSCKLSSGVRKAEESLEGVVISVQCKTILFKVRAEEEYGPYYCLAFALRGIANRFYHVVQVFLKESVAN